MPRAVAAHCQEEAWALVLLVAAGRPGMGPGAGRSGNGRRANGEDECGSTGIARTGIGPDRRVGCVTRPIPVEDAGRPGAGGADAGPADFHSPEGAVKAFLDALKAKDLDRLNESTALRAAIEASAKNQELFQKIFELTLSDSELDELAKKLEGYTIAGENPPKSTGRVDVILQKGRQ